MLVRLKDWDTLVNTNFIQDINKIDDKTILITMANGKEYEHHLKEEQTIDKVMTHFMSVDQHPAAIHKVEIVGLANILKHSK